MEPVRVLSIDGGGIRGIIPALVLGELERLTGRPVASLFHLIAGTSTGGLLALGLTTPARYRAEDLARVYETESGRVFSWCPSQGAHAPGGHLGEKHRSQELEEVLHRYFGEVRLSEALTDVLVPAYDLERRLPFFFRSSRARVRADQDVPVRVAAQATAAAPTHFEPVHVDGFTLVDGGVYASNPAMFAYIEAVTSWPEAVEILVVSLGTGEIARPIPPLDPLGHPLFAGVSDMVDHQLERLCNDHTEPGDSGRRRRYWRVQPLLPEDHGGMDDARPENLQMLRCLAEELVDRRRADLEDLAARLVPT